MTNWKPGKNVEHIIFTIPETPLYLFLVAVICPGTHPTAASNILAHHCIHSNARYCNAVQRDVR